MAHGQERALALAWGCNEAGAMWEGCVGGLGVESAGGPGPGPASLDHEAWAVSHEKWDYSDEQIVSEKFMS